MYRLIQVCCLLFFTPLFLVAQTIPKEGSALNYRIVGFSFPEKKQINNCKVEIASGNYNDENVFEKNIIVTVAAKRNKAVAEVPAFGRQYTWRVVYPGNPGRTKSELYHFSTMMSPNVDPDSVRMRVITSSEKYKDDYVFVDGNKVLYDMKGNPVWFFPEIDGLSASSMHLRDLHLSQFGTITTIIHERIYEISYNGAVLWKGPGNGKIRTDSTNFEDAYHHEFVRLDNGHYMTMGFEQDIWQLPGPVDSATFVLFHGKITRDKNDTYYQKMLFGTLIEYDEQGKIVWKWNGSDYFKGSDLSARMTMRIKFLILTILMQMHFILTKRQKRYS